MNHQRSIIIGQIQIGDYADITFIKPKSKETDGHAIYDSTHRYYIIKINDNEITVKEWNDFKLTLLLKFNGENIWQIDNYTESHTITFNKNKTDTDYIERDFTQASVKSIIIDDRRGRGRKPIFGNNKPSELKNGIILYRIARSHILGFSDPNNTLRSTTKYLSEDIKATSDLNQAATFTDFQFPSNLRGDWQIMNFIDDNNEIFIYFNTSRNIIKLDINELTYTIYDQTPGYFDVYPLKNRKILCLLNYDKFLILDLVTNTKSIINPSSLTIKEHPRVYQLSTGDVILHYWNGQHGELCRLNINDQSLTKIAPLVNTIEIIAVLKDDTILVMVPGTVDILKEIQIWDLNTQEIINVATLTYNPNNRISIIPTTSSIPAFYTISTIPKRLHKAGYMPEISIIIKSILLKNGDVLFDIGDFYLFSHESRQIIYLPAFEEIKPAFNYQELQNGNLLIANNNYLRIMEFPHSPRVIDRNNFDQISQSIKASLKLPPDMLTLIRSYL